MGSQLFNDEVNRRFYDVTARGRDQLWKLVGIDGSAVRNLAREVNQQLIDLASNVQSEMKNLESAKAVAEQHEKSVKRLRKLIELEVQGVIPSGSIDDLIPASLCHCGIAMFADFDHHEHNLFPPVPTPESTATIMWDDPAPFNSCSGHPYVDVHGPGNSALSTAELESSCIFTFVPSSAGLYCIRPVVQLSGHYLAWTWGGCEQEPGRACVRVRVEVEVEQPADDVIQTQSLAVVNECASFPTGESALQSGFAYDSTLQGGTGINVVLMSGEQVTVRVTCTSFAQVFNLGRAWVDMQTNPLFYFRVPLVRWGQMICP